MADSRTSQLRQVLDTLQVDQDVKEERDYLVSVLRRLGYTDRQIQRELGVDLGVEEDEDDTVGERTVEVEYLDGHLDIKEYEPVYRASQDELVQPGSEGPHADFSIGEAGDDVGPEGDWNPQAESTSGEFGDDTGPEEQEPATFQILAPEDDDLMDFSEAPDEDEDLLDFEETPSPEDMAWPESGRRAEPDQETDEDLDADESEWAQWPEEREAEEGWLPEDDSIETEFQAVGPEDPPRNLRVTVVRAKNREEALEKARGKGLDPVHAVPVSVEQNRRRQDWEVHEAPPDAPFMLGDYTLHKREVTRKDGGVTPLYFFAKNPPKSGHPAPMPEGYTLHESERTGLPYLKKE